MDNIAVTQEQIAAAVAQQHREDNPCADMLTRLLFELDRAGVTNIMLRSQMFRHQENECGRIIREAHALLDLPIYRENLR
jgi:hypothetical protein